jgi:hypothetical protein
MKSTRSLLLSLLLVAFALPLAAQVNDTYVIPVVGNVPGAFGTRWMSQFSVFNPQSYRLTLSVVYVPTGGGQGIEKLIDVPANGTWATDNAMQSIFGVAGSGALLVAAFPEDNPSVEDSVIARSFLVTTNTFNNSSAGTFGQTIPGVWAGLEADDITAIAHGIRNIASQGWRTNVGAVNLGRTSVVMHVSVYDSAGRTLLNAAPFSVPPLAHMQDRLPVEVDRGSVEFWIDDPSGEAVVFPYTSTIDQLSGDPTYQNPTLLALPHTLFGKTGRTMKMTATVNPGKKIDIATARTIRSKALRLGTATPDAAK